MPLTLTPKSPMPHKTQGTSCPIKAIVTKREESMKEATIDEVMGATHQVLWVHGGREHSVSAALKAFGIRIHKGLHPKKLCTATNHRMCIEC
jgi:hypothetical protein